MRSLSESLFDIDGESETILKILAKNGPSTVTRIANARPRKNNWSREVIGRRIQTTDLKDGFLSTKKGRKIRNLKDKHEKFFSLTFKGFLASLVTTPIRENFWIKNYLKYIGNIANDLTSKIFLEHIYFFICSFLIFHSTNKGMLQKYVKPEEEFYDNYFGIGSLNHLFVLSKVKRMPKEHQETFVRCLKQFYISSEVLGSLITNSLPATCGDDSKDMFVTDFFRRWMWTMFLDLNKTPAEIMYQYTENDNYPDNLIDGDGRKIVNFGNIHETRFPFDEIHHFAKNEFLRISANGRFSQESLILSQM